MARSWTNEQSQAIWGRGGSMLISAAAGSGKTAVLVQRAIQRITDPVHPVDADRLLIATFSNAAAGEMKDRIAAALNDLLAADPGNSLLQRQRLLLQKAHISTIHSFCLELVRQHFDVLGLDARFSIGDETQLSDLRSSAMEELLETCYSRGESSFFGLCEFFCGKTDRPLSQLILTVYDFLRSNPFPEQWMERSEAAFSAGEVAGTPWGSLLFDYASDTLAYAGQLLRQGLYMMEDDPAMKTAYEPAFSEDLRQLELLQEHCAARDWDGLYHGVRSFYFVRMGQLRKYEDAEKKERVSGLRKEVKKLLSDLSARQVSSSQADYQEDMRALFPIVRALFAAVREYGEILERLKREARIVDFSDLEHYTLRLLCTVEPDGRTVKTDFARELSDSFEEIMLDEYQDTNEIQDTIFTLLSREGENLFMVGDVKQSIYRFRQARPELFLRRQDAYAPFDGQTFPALIKLSKNFRSRKEVADGVNFLFSQLMARRLGEVDYNEDEALVPAGEFLPLPDRACELHIVETGEADEEKGVAEARHVAGVIESMLAQGFPVQDGGKARPCRPRDFCILLRTSKKAGAFAKELAARGVLAWSDTTTGYFDSREISVMLSLLRIIDNPLQDIPLLSVLMSPMGGFTPDDVANIRLCDKNASMYVALLACAKGGNQRAQAFLNSLAEMRRWAAVLSAGALIQKIYDGTDFMAVVGAMPSGAQKQANLRLLLDYANRYEATGGSGLSGFLRFVDRAVKNGEDFLSANTISEQADVVRIMTIHRSKGLEFPVCIVADCGKRFNREDLNAASLLHPELGFSTKMREPDKLKAYTTLRQEAIRLKLEEETLSEEMRVLYVAMTRAEEKLILTMECGDLDKKLASLSLRAGEGQTFSPYGARRAASYGDWLLMAALRHPDAGELRARTDAPQMVIPGGELRLRILPAAGESPAAEEQADFAALPTPELMETIRENVEYSYPYRALSGVAAKLAVTQIVHQGGNAARLDALPAFRFGKKMTPAQRGTIVHKFIQFADYAAGREDLLAEMERLMVEGFLTEEETAVLPVGKLAAFFSSPLMGRILAADRVLREFRFFDEVPAGRVYPGLPQDAAGEKILVQGIADCVIVEDGKAVVIDYKTDGVREAGELRERYAGQLLFYKDAVEKALGIPVGECILYSVPLEEAVHL